MFTRQCACQEHRVVEKGCYLLTNCVYIAKAEGLFGVQRVMTSRRGASQSTHAWITSNAVICQHAHSDSYLRKPPKTSLHSRAQRYLQLDALMILS